MRARAWLALGAALGLAWLRQPVAAQAEQRRACLDAHVEAQTLQMRGSFVAAREKLLRCARASCPALIANDCTRWLSDNEESLSSVVFAVSDPAGRDLSDARVFANDVLLSLRSDGRAVWIDPGTYRFRIEAPAHEPTILTLSVGQSEKDRVIRVTLSPWAAAAAAGVSQPMAASAKRLQSSAVPPGTYVFGALALAGAGAATVFGVVGKNRYDDAKACARVPSCTELESLKTRGRRDYLVSTLALGVAVASATTAVLWYFLGTAADPAPHDVALDVLRLEPDLERRGATLRWTTRY